MAFILILNPVVTVSGVFTIQHHPWIQLTKSFKLKLIITLQVPMEIESLENSPGNTLKRKIDVTVMSESPAPRRRLESGGARLEDAPPRTNMNPQVGRELY